MDVADEKQAKAAVEEAVKQIGRIDVLVNNAGYSLLGNFEELTTAEIERQFTTNFYGVVYVMRAVLTVMRKQRSGRIINISSVAGVVGLKHCAAYGATKFTVVEPGFFRTDLLDARNVRWGSNVIEDYAAEGNIQETWSAYHGKQQGDPAKLGEVLVKIAGMENPPKQFLAGSDALTLVSLAFTYHVLFP